MTQSHQTRLSEVTGDEFKLVMRRFAASVNVISSADSSKKSGMTATTVCGVSAGQLISRRQACKKSGRVM